MVDVSKLRIHERWNVESLNSLVLITKIGNKNWENWLISIGQIWELAKLREVAEYRMDEQFVNCQFLERNFSFPNGKNSRSLLIFQFKQ